MTIYLVATYVTVEADSPKDAAMKAYILHHEMTPEEYDVTNPMIEDDIVEELILSEDDKERALELQRQGKLFPTTDLNN